MLGSPITTMTTQSAVNSITTPVTTVPMTYSASSARPITTLSGTSYAAAPAVTTIAAKPAGATYVAGSATAGSMAVSGLPTTYPMSGTVQAKVLGAQPSGALATSVAALKPASLYAPAPVAGSLATSRLINAVPVGATVVSATSSANLLAAGTVVSQRVVSMEECLATGLVRTEGAAPTASPPPVVMQAPALVEPVVAQQFQQPEFAAPVEMTEAIQQDEIDPQKMLEVFTQEQQPVMEGEIMQAAPPRVVIVCTGVAEVAGGPTGAWSEEITGPYYVFQEAGCEVYLASVNGGQVPIDELSLQQATANDQRFQNEDLYELLLKNVYSISADPPEVPVDQIDCVFLAGGHGTYGDFENGLAQFVTDVAGQGKPVGAVCHGVIGLLAAINQDSTPLLAGRQCTGFSDAEEIIVGLADKVPFSVQKRMEDLQSVYSCAEPWTEYALRDGNIITGQNPQSSIQAAQLCVQALSETLNPQQ